MLNILRPPSINFLFYSFVSSLQFIVFIPAPAVSKKKRRPATFRAELPEITTPRAEFGAQALQNLDTRLGLVITYRLSLVIVSYY